MRQNQQSHGEPKRGRGAGAGAQASPSKRHDKYSHGGSFARGISFARSLGERGFAPAQRPNTGPRWCGREQLAVHRYSTADSAALG